MARTQRVENLIKDFMLYHKKGYSIPEIAEIFKVDFSTVYNHLQEIAENNGFKSRDELLERIKSTSSSHCSFRREKIDIKKLQNDFDKIESDINEIILEIDSILKNAED